ncbi:uncharacterized protein LOC143286956 isoform X2 [Babylonia areolata]|uniref:uncharacterized protein LOC143286956 isoform X2 n=1 Tax=Babylonia areolata TaxID=304850 RepID=UPI003FD0AB7C
MGAKSSKTEVFYTFVSNDPKELIDELKRKMKGTHVSLKPMQQPDEGGPILDFRECPDPAHIDDHFQDSQRQSPNHLMVVLTTQELAYYYTSSKSLVQLVCKRKGKGRTIEMSEVNKRSIDAIVEFLDRGGREESGLPVVHMAFGDWADGVVKEAVRFVEMECGIRLLESPHLGSSRPLLVFCKNSTQLQEDIRHATENTRDGWDVMLLVLTDRTKLVIRDTEATQNFGAKDCLVFSHSEKRYRFSENEAALKWIKKFLGRFQIEVSIRMSRTDSMKRSFIRLLKSEEKGAYQVLGEMSEQEAKNVVLFFDKQNVGLTQAEHGQHVSPLVLLCAASQQPERLLRSFHQDLRDVYLVITTRSSEGFPALAMFPNLRHGRLTTSDVSAKVVENAQNKRVVDGVRKFLRKHTAPSQRPQTAVQGDEPQYCEVESGHWELGTPESPEGAAGPSVLCVSGRLESSSEDVEGDGEGSDSDVVISYNDVVHDVFKVPRSPASTPGSEEVRTFQPHEPHAPIPVHTQPRTPHPHTHTHTVPPQSAVLQDRKQPRHIPLSLPSNIRGTDPSPPYGAVHGEVSFRKSPSSTAIVVVPHFPPPHFPSSPSHPPHPNPNPNPHHPLYPSTAIQVPATTERGGGEEWWESRTDSSAARRSEDTVGKEERQGRESAYFSFSSSSSVRHTSESCATSSQREGPAAIDDSSARSSNNRATAAAAAADSRRDSWARRRRKQRSALPPSYQVEQDLGTPPSPALPSSSAHPQAAPEGREFPKGEPKTDMSGSETVT